MSCRSTTDLRQITLPEIVENIKHAWAWLLQHGAAAEVDCDRISVMGIRPAHTWLWYLASR